MTDNTRYSDEVRDTALARVNAGISQRQVARELGIGASTVNKWVTLAKLVLLKSKLSSVRIPSRRRKRLQGFERRLHS